MRRVQRSLGEWHMKEMIGVLLDDPNRGASTVSVSDYH